MSFSNPSYSGVPAGRSVVPNVGQSPRIKKTQLSDVIVAKAFERGGVLMPSLHRGVFCLRSRLSRSCDANIDTGIRVSCSLRSNFGCHRRHGSPTCCAGDISGTGTGPPRCIPEQAPVQAQSSTRGFRGASPHHDGRDVCERCDHQRFREPRNSRCRASSLTPPRKLASQ